MPRQQHPCSAEGCQRLTTRTHCFLHSSNGGGRKAADWLLDVDVTSDLGIGKRLGPRSFRLFCISCARDAYTDEIPSGGRAYLYCQHCGGRVFVESDDLQPHSWLSSGVVGQHNVGRRIEVLRGAE